MLTRDTKELLISAAERTLFWHPEKMSEEEYEQLENIIYLLSQDKSLFYNQSVFLASMISGSLDKTWRK